MCLVKLIIKLSDSMQLSSIAPIELYTKVLESRRAKENILVSWLESSSSAPSPSESITIMLIFFLSFVTTSIGLPQIHSPFVHGFTVGPTSKPEMRSRITLFKR